ncbi:MAG: hypothetical protein WBV88_06010, partial [Candidatus Rickettsiella isopodorum]
MNFIKIIVIGLLINFSMKSFAMLPVVDAGAIANLIKNFNQLKSQYELLQQTYQNAQHQLE